VNPDRIVSLESTPTKTTILALFKPQEKTMDTQVDTNTDTDVGSWQTWHSMKAPPSGDFRVWMHWAVTRFSCLDRSPLPLDSRDIDKWRPLFVKWARTASPTVREICLFLLQFSHVNGAFAPLRSASYNLHHALANMDNGNRQGMGAVIMHARIY
jgi:hypothetical protein